MRIPDFVVKSLSHDFKGFVKEYGNRQRLAKILKNIPKLLKNFCRKSSLKTVLKVQV
jgi:hypothetical protein